MEWNPGGENRSLYIETLQADLVVVGGGIAGVCAALAAAREQLKVVLVQDRPVLGGNASSEVRLWILGATSHMGNNNRWAREGGIVDEILVENMYRNPEGNAVVFDAILLDKVWAEPNIRLLLNTAVFQVHKQDADSISSLDAFCSQNQTLYHLQAPLFVDASGDGLVGFLAGAAFRMGAEPMEEFGEKFAPSKEYGELLGHSLYFYTRDTGKPVTFVPPSFALQDITTIPRFRSFNARDYGCRLWWIEYGGRLHTVRETESIKWELWKVVYGVWNHIKNSGEFPEAANLTLEWVGTIPGKRESRRFEGDYMLRQQDIVEQRVHADAIGYGGWSIDLHPADGVFSEKPGCNQWHSKGIYQIPFRCIYSRNIRNLLLAGRGISASHVAFGSSRVMATCGLLAQAAGTAAALCLQHQQHPAGLWQRGLVPELQQQLLKRGVYIPGVVRRGGDDLVQQASLSASSEFQLTQLPEGSVLKKLDHAVAQLLPMQPGPIPVFRLNAWADSKTELCVEWRISQRPDNYTPECLLESLRIPLQPGNNEISLSFRATMPHQAYGFLTFLRNPAISMRYTDLRVTGLLSVFNQVNPSVSNYGFQQPSEDIGVDAFAFWCPERRPGGHNLAFSASAPIHVFAAENLRNGTDRPTTQPNAWVASPDDKNPTVTINWNEPQTIRSIELCFDTDFDHPMESVLMGHPERVMPFCIRSYTLEDEAGNILASVKDNYTTRNCITLPQAVTTRQLVFRCQHPSEQAPAALFAIRCFDH